MLMQETSSSAASSHVTEPVTLTAGFAAGPSDTGPTVALTSPFFRPGAKATGTESFTGTGMKPACSLRSAAKDMVVRSSSNVPDKVVTPPEDETCTFCRWSFGLAQLEITGVASPWGAAAAAVSSADAEMWVSSAMHATCAPFSSASRSLPVTSTLPGTSGSCTGPTVIRVSPPGTPGCSVKGVVMLTLSSKSSWPRTSALTSRSARAEPAVRALLRLPETSRRRVPPLRTGSGERWMTTFWRMSDCPPQLEIEGPAEAPSKPADQIARAQTPRAMAGWCCGLRRNKA
mmetsp:Transcript_45271/g.144248  ORF Transcript_45271/g.144248 Transcript_45271/m.144248 type:complete len:288 (-) Transcript_45271:9-872(-)